MQDIDINQRSDDTCSIALKYDKIEAISALLNRQAENTSQRAYITLYNIIILKFCIYVKTIFTQMTCNIEAFDMMIAYILAYFGDASRK